MASPSLPPEAFTEDQPAWSRSGRARESGPQAIAGRVPPHDIDSEAAVLAAVLLEKNAIDEVVGILHPRDMYAEAHRWILEGAFELAAAAKPVDIVSVAGWLRDRDRLVQCGGAAYLAQLSDTVPAVAHVETYAKRVVEKASVRKLIATCQTFAAEGYGDYGDAAKFIDGAEQAIFDIARPSNDVAAEYVGPILERGIRAVTEAAARGERITGYATGFERLDSKTAGLHDGDLTIVAARPGMGKTAFVLNVAVNVASPKPTDKFDNDGLAVNEAGLAVFVSSLEMPREQLATRMVCSAGRVDLGKMRQGFLQNRDWDNLTTATAFLYRLPIMVDDTPAIGVLALRAKVRRFQAEIDRNANREGAPKRVGLVIVDYLQLMSGSRQAANREQEISEVSRGLKALAKELRVPVIALSQLNRAVETRSTKDKRPQLSDLRESGAIEQDADNIIFIYRDDYYHEDSDVKGIAELIVAKQRNGPTGKVRVRFDAAFTRFDNLAPGDPSEFEDDDDADRRYP